MDSTTCYLTNHHRWQPLTVWNLEYTSEQFGIELGGGRVPIPFELFGVTAGTVHFLTVHGPEPYRPPPLPASACVQGLFDPQWRPRRGTRGHAVLAALCRTTDLRYPPQARDIAAELGMTVRAVQGQIDYLAGRLGVRPVPGGRRPGWKLQALAQAGHRLGIVE
ncbi:hypothetical protein [Streptomyces sp. 184]|uniref:hypothetical protein n=1 Tax=Streptomyces sp. 184 TaxID=1827526 RepID=UPI003891C5F6